MAASFRRVCGPSLSPAPGLALPLALADKASRGPVARPLPAQQRGVVLRSLPSPTGRTVVRKEAGSPAWVRKTTRGVDETETVAAGRGGLGAVVLGGHGLV